MTPQILLCPAKINLYLAIRGKRPDGYHELGTLFQSLDFGDTLRAEPWDSIELLGAGGIPGKPGDNLILKAAELLRLRYPGRIPAHAGIRFSLEKRIPFGAGLGGGSSDAAGALKLGNQLWKLGLTAMELHGLACELGSDIPFFLGEETAFGEGRGEVLSSAPHPFPFHVVVATPKCHVETAWAYRNAGPRMSDDGWEAFKSQFCMKAGEPEFYAQLHNDFETPILSHFPEIRDTRETLLSFEPEKALLTGSGASLFALFRREDVARACLESVAPQCRFSILTHFAQS